MGFYLVCGVWLSSLSSEWCYTEALDVFAQAVINVYLNQFLTLLEQIVKDVCCDHFLKNPDIFNVQPTTKKAVLIAALWLKILKKWNICRY